MNIFDRVEYNKESFKSLVRKSDLTKIEDLKFSYRRDGNDEYTKHGKQRRMATLEFYLDTPTERTLIVYKEHRRSHDILEEELTKRYTRWAKQVLKEKSEK